MSIVHQNATSDFKQTTPIIFASISYCFEIIFTMAFNHPHTKSYISNAFVRMRLSVHERNSLRTLNACLKNRFLLVKPPV